MYYVYILRCTGNILYTGITNDVNRRMSAHFEKKSIGAKFTKSHQAESLEAVWECEGKSAALKLEYRIKQLTKPQKLKLISENSLDIVKEINSGDYTRQPLDLYENYVN